MQCVNNVIVNVITAYFKPTLVTHGHSKNDMVQKENAYNIKWLIILCEFLVNPA
jgi:hypothetical protein